MGTYDVRNQSVASAEADGLAWEEPSCSGLDETGFLRGLIHGMRCGILCVDRHRRLVLLNGLAAQTLEIETLPAPGAPMDTALAAHPQLVQVLEDCFGMSCLPNRAELDLISTSGKLKTVGFTISNISSDGGEPTGVAMFFKDLTQIEHKEEQERLKDRLAALGQMAASLAHEIRNPLASIEVTCSLVRRRLAADEGGRELMDKITTEVRRLNRTITSSLEFVRPVSLSVAEAEIAPLLDEAIKVAAERTGGDGARIERNFGEAFPPFLMDRAQLRQVFENLILNALEAAGGGGLVAVELERLDAPSSPDSPIFPEGPRTNDPWLEANQFAVVRIADSGPGIPEEERDKIFYPFFTTKKHGSGVGLSMAKKIVASHRGLIDVDRAPQGGARFTVRLPMVDATPEG